MQTKVNRMEHFDRRREAALFLALLTLYQVT
jgi:hypothetical protein